MRVSCLHIIFIKKLTTKYSGTDFKLCETNTIKGTTFWEHKFTEPYIGSFWVVWHFVSVAATCPFLPSQQTGACQVPGHLPYQGKHREFLCDRASSVSQGLSSAQKMSALYTEGMWTWVDYEHLSLHCHRDYRNIFLLWGLGQISCYVNLVTIKASSTTDY